MGKLNEPIKLEVNDAVGPGIMEVQVSHSKVVSPVSLSFEMDEYGRNFDIAMSADSARKMILYLLSNGV